MLKAALTGIFLIGVTGAAYAADATDGKGEVVLNGTIATLASPSELGTVANVKPGEELTITGACVVNVKSADRLRVMLTSRR